MNKYRIRKRAKGWSVQLNLNHISGLAAKDNPRKPVWLKLSTHRSRRFATLKLWFLREFRSR